MYQSQIKVLYPDGTNSATITLTTDTPFGDNATAIEALDNGGLIALSDGQTYLNASIVLGFQVLSLDVPQE